MRCGNCDREIDNSAKFCPYCGSKVELYTEPDPQTPLSDGYADDKADFDENTGKDTVREGAQVNSGYYTSYNAEAAAAQKSNGIGIAGMVLGICTLVLCLIPGISLLSIITGILGIVLSACSRSKYGKNGFATAGLVMSIIGLVLLLITILFFAAVFLRIGDFIINVL